MTLTDNRPPMRFLSVDVGEWGSVLLAECRNPESNAEQWDLGLGFTCPVHSRTVYFCADRQALWCDGYVGGTEFRPHELDVVAGREIDGPVEVVGCAADPGCFLPDGHTGEHVP